MKKIISIILVSILTLTLFTVGSSAGNKNCANLIVTDASFSIDNHGALALAAPDFPVVGKETQYKIAVTDADPETFVIKFEFCNDKFYLQTIMQLGRATKLYTYILKEKIINFFD